MSVYWERLAGDTSVFAIRLGFQSDPDEGRGVDAEDAASWGSLQIWLQGRNICSHFEYSESTESITWYLLPLMEWLLTQWDAMLHEERLPVANRGDDASSSLEATRLPPLSAAEPYATRWEHEWFSWRTRHSVSAARSGGLVPGLVLRRWRDLVEFSWDSDSLAGLPADFRFDVPEGVARVSSQSAAQPLFEVLGDAARELARRLPSSDRVEGLLNAVGLVEDANRRIRRRAWLAALGTDEDEVVARWASVEERAESIGGEAATSVLGLAETPLVVTEAPAAAQLLSTAESDVADADVDRLVDLLIESVRHAGDSEVDRFAENVPLVGRDDATRQGYELAYRVMEEFNLNPAEVLDVDALLGQLGVRVPEVVLASTTTRAATLGGPSYRPTIALNQTYPWIGRSAVRRFTLARALCHLLFDRNVDGRVAIASGMGTPRDIDRRAGAFAAALLMPFPLVQRIVRDLGSVTSEDDVLEVARRLDLSASATLEHLANLGFLDPEMRDALREGLHWSRMTRRDRRQR